MIILLIKSQLALFDMPVHVGAHVRKDGAVVKPHVRIQKVALKPQQQAPLFGDQDAPAPKKRRTKLDAFVDKHGGLNGLARMMAGMTEGQQQQVFSAMAKISDGKTPAEIAAMFDGVAPAEPAKGETLDLFADAAPAPKEPEPAKVKDKGQEIVEHVTRKGKTLRGIIRHDLTKDEAQAIDLYTFKKDGGWFIREKHVTGDEPVQEKQPETVVQSEVTEQSQPDDGSAKRKAQAEKLRSAGEKLLASAEQEYERPRLSNTVRRARMAASSEAAAAKEIRIAKTMINLSWAIEDGDVKYLSGVNTKAAVKTLDDYAKRAVMEADKDLSHAEREGLRGRDASDADVDKLSYPSLKWGYGGTSASKVLDAIKGKRGSKALADKVRYSTGPTPELVVEISKFVDRSELKNLIGWWNVDRLAEINRLQKLGITDTQSLRSALKEFLQYRGGKKAADPVKEAERALVGKKVGIDFFPTPKTLAASMAEAASIKPGMRVLEPSAGNGHLADAAKAAGADVDTVEISDTLRNILQAKGHNLAGRDFNEFSPAVQYDAILMNPPFSDRQDAAHIMRAWDMLKPGGTLVAIAGEGVFFGSDKRASEFRDWLSIQGAEIEQLPQGTFMGADLPAQTGVNARLIKLTKQEERAAKPMKNYGWDSVKLSDAYSLEELHTLRQQVEAQHANPKDEQGHPTENGQSTIHLYDKEGRRKLDKLSWAVKYKLDDKKAAQQDDGPKEGERNADGLVFRDGRWHRDDEPETVSNEPAASTEEPTETDLAEDREDLADELMRNPHSEKAKSMLSAAAARHAKTETPQLSDEDDPNSPNYRFADTGYIAGSRKEEAAANVIQRAKRDGAQVLIQHIDWDGLEQNPREAKTLITKSNLFGLVPWDQLREQGMEPGAGFLIDRIYASIGQEPTEDNAQARHDYTLGLQTLRTRLESCKTAAQVTDVLNELRNEFDGKVLNAEESAAYEKVQSAINPMFDRLRELSKEADEHRKAYYAAIQEYGELSRKQDQRLRRNWKPDPEIAKRMAELEPEKNRLSHEWESEQNRRNAEERGLREQIRELRLLSDSVIQMAYARNKIENPLHRAWTIMGEKFVNVLRYRSYKGSEAFQKHVTAAKSGAIKDWSWAEKEGATKTPRVTKESARFQMRVVDRFERKGGRAVNVGSTMELKNHFGLRDVQSGNWVLKDPVSAKFHVEQSAAAFADLADLIGVPDDLVSFKGRLAMAFGARGKGNAGFGGAAAAHYEPVHRVINMTKMGGGGSLAHEWFHAVDNLIKEAEGLGDSRVDDFITEKPDLLPPGPLRDAFANLREAMTAGEHQLSRTHHYTDKDYRLARHNLDRGRVSGMALTIKNAKDASEALAKIAEYFDPRASYRGAAKHRKQWEQIALAWHGGNPDGGTVEAKSGSLMSAFMLGAHELDSGSKRAYYSQVKEMAARAFQSWVEDRMAGMGRRNDYLSSYADNKYHIDPLFGIEWKPFPEGAERERINAAFDNLMAVLGEQNILAKALSKLDMGAFTLVDEDAGALAGRDAIMLP